MRSPLKPFAGRIGAVLLAAGGSSRFGRNKQLLVWQGEPLVRRAARAALDSGVDELVVVLGAEPADVGSALEGLPLQRVENADWAKGMGGSIACGVRATRSEAVLLLLADQPGVDAGLLRRLIDGARAGHSRVACAYSGVLGVPALFAEPGDLAALRELEGDHGARALLVSKSEAVLAIPAELASFDVDTEVDWTRWMERHGAS